MSKTLPDLVKEMQGVLADLRSQRDKLVGRLDLQIQGLESAIAALDKAAGESPASAIVPQSDEAYEPSHSTMSPAQMVLACVRRHPGLPSTEIIERVYKHLRPRGNKSQRKVASSAIYDLRQRKKLETDARGGLHAVRGPLAP